jgi:hypothetical protein
MTPWFRNLELAPDVKCVLCFLLCLIGEFCRFKKIWQGRYMFESANSLSTAVIRAIYVLMKVMTTVSKIPWKLLALKVVTRHAI